MTGQKFRELHLLFEEHYMVLASNEVAERIRTLGINRLSSIVEINGTPETGWWNGQNIDYRLRTDRKDMPRGVEDHARGGEQ